MPLDCKPLPHDERYVTAELKDSNRSYRNYHRYCWIDHRSFPFAFPLSIITFTYLHHRGSVLAFSIYSPYYEGTPVNYFALGDYL